jgi:ribonucleotide monophosphatase NagD (HAD superfamily)
MIGKPEPTLFEAGLKLLGLEAREVAMVGDNPVTDGEGARRLGLRFFQMREGRFPVRPADGKRAGQPPPRAVALPA